MCIAAVSLHSGQTLAGYTALGSPLLLAIPPLYSRLFCLPRFYGFDLRYLAFAFLTCPAGVGLTLYHLWPRYDSFAHLLSGLFFAEVGYWLFVLLNGLSADALPQRRAAGGIFALCFSGFIALCWELLEFAASLLFAIDPQKVATTGVTDTMLDGLWCLLGTIFYLFWLWPRLGRPTLPENIHALCRRTVKKQG